MEEVSVPTLLVYHTSQQALQGLGEPLYKSLRLGWMMDILVCLTCNSQHTSAINLDTKGVPWFVKISLGMPTWQKRRTSSQIMFLDVASRIPASSSISASHLPSAHDQNSPQWWPGSSQRREDEWQYLINPFVWCRPCFSFLFWDAMLILSGN